MSGILVSTMFGSPHFEQLIMKIRLMSSQVICILSGRCFHSKIIFAVETFIFVQWFNFGVRIFVPACTFSVSGRGVDPLDSLE